MRPWRLSAVPFIVLAACGEDGSTGDASRPPVLAYAVVRCHENAGTSVFGPDTLEIRRGDDDPVTVMEIPASDPAPDPLCRVLGFFREVPSAVTTVAALTRVAVSPDGSAVIFEVTDEFAVAPRNLSSEQKQIFLVGADGSGLRSLGPASRGGPGVGQGFRFSPDGRRVVFNDRGPDHAGNEAEQVVVLDIAPDTIGMRTQVTHLSPGRPAQTLGSVCCPRFIDNETIAFRTTLDADGMHPTGGAFTVRTDGTELTAVPLPSLLPGSRIVPDYIITGDQPTATTLYLEGEAVNAQPPPLDKIREVFFVDGANLLQLTKFDRVDTIHALLSVDRQRVFFAASVNRRGENPEENCQLFSIDVSGADLRQLTNFSVGRRSFGCQGSPNPAASCTVRRLFQDPVTQTVVFFSNCDPFGTNPYGVQVFSVRPDGTGLRQVTDLRRVTIDADSTSAELLGAFAYPGTGTAFGD